MYEYIFVFSGIVITSACCCIRRRPTIPLEEQLSLRTHLCQEECIICIEDYQPHDVLCTLKCNHTFHKECIENWIHYSSTTQCPICSKPF